MLVADDGAGGRNPSRGSGLLRTGGPWSWVSEGRVRARERARASRRPSPDPREARSHTDSGQSRHSTLVHGPGKDDSEPARYSRPVNIANLITAPSSSIPHGNQLSPPDGPEPDIQSRRVINVRSRGGLCPSRCRGRVPRSDATVSRSVHVPRRTRWDPARHSSVASQASTPSRASEAAGPVLNRARGGASR